MKITTQKCAIYTRKSTDKGLEQEFNTLDAQREACLAYIVSQKSEGWTAIKQLYDDGGYSGGSIERPALQQLLEDIKSRKINIVVVYKIDRLTRSLTDFAKLVEVFDQYGVSFVSITQSFNTTTSMGRLTARISWICRKAGWNLWSGGSSGGMSILAEKHSTRSLRKTAAPDLASSSLCSKVSRSLRRSLTDSHIPLKFRDRLNNPFRDNHPK